jgi:hypothetical protein
VDFSITIIQYNLIPVATFRNCVVFHPKDHQFDLITPNYRFNSSKATNVRLPIVLCPHIFGFSFRAGENSQHEITRRLNLYAKISICINLILCSFKLEHSQILREVKLNGKSSVMWIQKAEEMMRARTNFPRFLLCFDSHTEKRQLFPSVATAMKMNWGKWIVELNSDRHQLSIANVQTNTCRKFSTQTNEWIYKSKSKEKVNRVKVQEISHIHKNQQIK